MTSIQLLGRSVTALLLAGAVAGCSSGGGASERKSTFSRAGGVGGTGGASDSCKSNRSACLYDGQYEAGERDYAEKEARRLNLAELERLRRSFGK